MVLCGLIEIFLTFCVYVRGIWIDVTINPIPAFQVAGKLLLVVSYFCAFFALCLFTTPTHSSSLMIICFFHSFFFSVPLTVKSIQTVTRNETVLERTINRRMKVAHPSFSNPYDMGFQRNFVQFFSSSIILWLFPIPLPLTHDSGLQYPTRMKQE